MFVKTLFRNALALGLGLGLTQPAAAQSDQFYFLASEAPIGSLSKHNTAARGVFLRWDVVESELPADLDTFVLLRDSTEVFRAPAQAGMGAAAITALYRERGQERRLAEMLSGLNAEASAPRGPQNDTAAQALPAEINANNIGVAIAGRLQDPLWAMLASRVDFNVARARHRGFLDRDYPTSGTIRYELRGIYQGGRDVRLGLVELQAGKSLPVPAPVDLSQVLRSRCDAPNAALDHGSVALNWSHGGFNAVDQFATGLSVTGYDIYRTIDNQARQIDGGVIAPRDLAAERRAAGYDASGDVALPGLERVNDSLIVISGVGDDPEFAQHRETRPQLQARNVNPGDVRHYYLVARDFTGNYGQTAAMEVIVPDVQAPPAPWGTEFRQDTRSKQVEIRWDEVNVSNWLARHGAGRTICNADTARADQRIAWVPEGEDCDNPVEVNLNVAGYHGYRFDNFDAAARFADSDGDGHGDLAERVASNTAPGTFDSGAACNAGVTLGDPIPVVDDMQVVTEASGKRIVVSQDDVPGAQPGTVYWYRVAAYGPGGISTLSPPLRVRFDDYSLPTVAELRDAVQLLVPRDECAVYDTEAEPKDGRTPPLFGGQGAQQVLAIDTTGDARNVAFYCPMRGRQGTPEERFGLAFRTSLSGGSVSRTTATPAQCSEIRRLCDSPSNDSGGGLQDSNPGTPSDARLHGMRAVFMDGTGKPLDEEGAPLSVVTAPQGCGSSAWGVLSKSYQPTTGAPDKAELCPADNPTRSPKHGEDNDGTLAVALDLQAKQCVSLFIDMISGPRRVQQHCGPEVDLAKLDLDGIAQGEYFCISASLHNDNNRRSPLVTLGCLSFNLPGEFTVLPPQLVSLGFEGDAAQMQWRLPQERSAATIIELYQGPIEGNTPVAVTTIGHGDGTVQGREALSSEGTGDGGFLRTALLDLDSLPAGSEEEYCARMRVVGAGSFRDSGVRLSEWSPPLCSVRVPKGQPAPDYMPWPAQAQTIANLNDASGQSFRQPVYLPYERVPLIPITTVVDFNFSASPGCDDFYFAGGDTLPSYPFQAGIGGGNCGNSAANCNTPFDYSFANASDDTSLQGAYSDCDQLASSAEDFPDKVPPSCSLTQIRGCEIPQPIGLCSRIRAQVAGHLNFVVYRQSRDEVAQQATDFYQVSPLVDRFHCETVTRDETNTDFSFEVPLDPYIDRRLVLTSAGIPAQQYAFRDHYPHIADRDYRYQVVWFDAYGEIERTHTTDWLEIE